MVEAPQSSMINTKNQVPLLALVGIFDKHNEPVILENYLVRHLTKENDTRLNNAEQALAGSEDAFEKFRRAAALEMEAIEMQMSMLAYSTLDIFADKSQIIPDRVKTMEDQKAKQNGREPFRDQEVTF